MLIPQNVGIDTKIKHLHQILWKLLHFHESPKCWWPYWRPSWISQIAQRWERHTPWISLWVSHRWIISKEKNFNREFWVILNSFGLLNNNLIGIRTRIDSTLRVASQRQSGQRVRPASERLSGRLGWHNCTSGIRVGTFPNFIEIA